MRSMVEGAYDDPAAICFDNPARNNYSIEQ
jgi:hypothetical protein